jgi:hypothetical protein
MHSEKPTGQFDFATGVSTTAADIEALHKARQLESPLEPWREVELLFAALPPAARVPSRETCAGFTPFEL